MYFKESEGIRTIQDTISPKYSSSYINPLKFPKVNIGSTKHPKIASIGDYWDKQTITKN
jgi:hypothetical protein